MTTNELFKVLAESCFSFTKPCNTEEQKYLETQKKSMTKLIICGLAKEYSLNKYTLTIEGKEANAIGVEKWAKTLSNNERRNLVYDSFGFKIDWYNHLIPNNTSIKQLKSSLSNLFLKAFGVIMCLFIIPLLLLIVCEKYKDEILKVWNILF